MTENNEYKDELAALTLSIAAVCSETESGHAYEPGVVEAALKKVLADLDVQKKEDVSHSFNVGCTYYTRSACDHDCVYSYIVVKRTAKSVWLLVKGGSALTFRRSISVYQSAEHCYPEGRYSMCPVLSAEREGGAA